MTPYVCVCLSLSSYFVKQKIVEENKQINKFKMGEEKNYEGPMDAN